MRIRRQLFDLIFLGFEIIIIILIVIFELILITFAIAHQKIVLMLIFVKNINILSKLVENLMY